jgi:uncharacterized protein (TIGR02246 family)
MSRFDIVATFISEELEKLKEKNPSFSLRAFARRLGISATSLSQIIQRKRPVTQKTAQLFINKFHLDSDKSQRILELLASPRKKGKSEDTDGIHKLVHDFAIVWNKHDFIAMARYWATDGCLIEPWGLAFDGRKAIEKFYSISHTTYLKDARIVMEVKSIVFSSCASAFIDVESTIFNIVKAQDSAPVDLAFNLPATVVKRKGVWKILATRPYVALPSTTQPWGTTPPSG